jgi:hypothetical protein
MVIEVGGILRKLNDVLALHPKLLHRKFWRLPNALCQPAHRHRDDIQRVPY